MMRVRRGRKSADLARWRHEEGHRTRPHSVSDEEYHGRAASRSRPVKAAERDGFRDSAPEDNARGNGPAIGDVRVGLAQGRRGGLHDGLDMGKGARDDLIPHAGRVEVMDIRIRMRVDMDARIAEKNVSGDGHAVKGSDLHRSRDHDASTRHLARWAKVMVDHAMFPHVSIADAIDALGEGSLALVDGFRDLRSHQFVAIPLALRRFGTLL